MGKLKTTVNVAKKILPEGVNVDEQIGKALRRKDVSNALNNYEGDPKDFIEGLKYYIQLENYKNYRLRKTASALDTGNRATIPIDTALDAASFFAGIGTAAKGVVTLAKLPFYLAYNLYYTGKTGDLAGAIKNMGYEAVSWLTPGSLGHLLKRYTKQADRYSIEKGSEKFLTGLEKKIKEKPNLKLIKGKQKSQENIEELAEAA